VEVSSKGTPKWILLLKNVVVHWISYQALTFGMNKIFEVAIVGF